MLLVQICASHWGPVLFCFIYLFKLRFVMLQRLDSLVFSSSRSKNIFKELFFSPLKNFPHIPTNTLSFNTRAFDPRQRCDALTAAALVVTERQTGWS